MGRHRLSLRANLALLERRGLKPQFQRKKPRGRKMPSHITRGNATPAALRVKIRDEGLVRNKAVHIALGVRADGAKEILGLWLEQNEGGKFWLRGMHETRN